MEENKNNINICDSYTIYPDKTAGTKIEIRATRKKNKKKQTSEKKSGRGLISVIALLLSIALVLAAGSACVFAVGFFIEKTRTDNSIPAGLDGNKDGWVNPGNLVSDQALINATAFAYDSVVSIVVKAGEAKSSGSGVILTSDGYIVTNNHVIEGEGNITVTLTNGKEYDATVIATDRQTDLGVIKIEANDLLAATLGTTDDLIRGAAVIAIGNPLGYLDGTVTSGIISALDRNIVIEGQKMTLIQTNAQVNPGNSGGGLFNIDGKLIGIVNAKSIGTNVDGLGYAIPINIVKDITTQLIEKQFIAGRSKIGISVVQINDININDILDFAPELSPYIQDNGVYITSSENEVLKLGDKIVSINGKPVMMTSHVLEAVGDSKVGDKLEMLILRKDSNDVFNEKAVTVTMIERTAADFQR